MHLEQIPVGPYRNFAYLVADEDTGEAAIVDPAWEVDLLAGRLVQDSATTKEDNLRLRYIINTHAHLDHIQGNQQISARTGARVVMHESSLARKDIGVRDGDEIRLGEVTLRFIHTPGHSPESMCIVAGESALLTGDTLFIGECGRVDLPGGDASALYDSFQKIKSLNAALIVYPGHDYGPKKSSTLGEQLKTNYTLAPRSREEFIKFMREP